MRKSNCLIILSVMLLLGLMGIVKAVGTSPSCTDSDGCVLFFKFNNDSSVGESYNGDGTIVYDYSSDQNNASAYNFTGKYNISGGYLGDGAFIFNTTNYLNVVNDSTYAIFSNSTNLTYMFWVNSLGSTLTQQIGTHNVQKMISPYFMANTNQLKIDCYYSNGTYFEVASSVVTKNIWSHVALTYSGSQFLVYINGVLVTTKSLDSSKSLRASKGLFSLGGFAGSRLNGTLDDLIILNRSLSSNEIKSIYNTYLGLECKSTNLFSGCLVSNDLQLNSTTNIFLNDTSNDSIGGAIKINSSNIMLDCNGSSFYGNYNFTGTTKTGILIQNSLSNVTIKNCNISGYHNGITLFSGVSNSTLLNNSIFRFSYSGIRIRYSDNNFIINNSIDGDGNNVSLVLYDYDNETSYNITIILGGGNSGISLQNSNYNTINNNSLRNLKYYGLSINSFSNSNNITNIYSFNNTYSIYLQSSGNNIINNLTSSKDKIFVYLRNSSTNYIYNTFFNGTSLYGNSIIYTFNNSNSLAEINNGLVMINGTFLNGHNLKWGYPIKDEFGMNNLYLENVYFKDFGNNRKYYGENLTYLNVTWDYLEYFVNLQHINNVNISFSTLRASDKFGLINITNLYFYNNTIYNISTGKDSYYIGLSIDNVNNYYIYNNNITGNQYGIMSKQSKNGLIHNNHFDNFNLNDVSILDSNKLVFEPMVGIGLVQNYKHYPIMTVNATNRNYNRYSIYNHTNITIYNNTFGNNTQVLLRSQGNNQITNDLTNYWFVKFRVNNLLDNDEFYISNNFNNLSNIYPALTNNNLLGIGSYWWTFNDLEYKLFKTYFYYKRPTTRADVLVYDNGYGGNLSLFNLSSPLISFSNGTSIYQSGTNLEYNYSLAPNGFMYVYEDLGDLELRRCNATINFTILNFTFMDEKNNSIKLNGTISQASFTYFADGLPQNITKNYNFTSSESNITFPICITPSDRNYWINYTLVYNGNGGYLERTQSSNYVLFSNITNNIQLSLLNTTNIITFQVINSLSQTISSAYVYVLPYLNDTILSSGYTDSGGIIQFLLNNGTTYRIYFSKSGYDSYSTLLNPTETFYTITLSGTGLAVVTPPDYTGGNPAIPNSVGVTYSTKPQNTWLNNGTYYNFNLTINSGTWNLTNWGFNLTDQSSNLINATSSTNASGGTLNINASTSNYTRVIMNFYYTINGTTINLQRVWLVLDLSDNNYSISHAIDDATNYINSGLFGITTRGLSFIVFFIIFIGAGILSFKFGLTSPVAICGFVFAMIWLFDVSLGWIPNPVSAVPHFATILIGITFLGFIVREVSQ